MAMAEKDDKANIGDLRSWHAHQEVLVRLAEESASRLVNGFVASARGPIMNSEQETFSVLSRLVGPDHPTPVRGTSEVDQETEHTAPSLWVGSQGDVVACGWIQRHCHGCEHNGGGGTTFGFLGTRG